MALALALTNNVPTSEEMDDFKLHVSAWLKLDSDITRLQTALRERRVAKCRLTTSVLAFMKRFGIDDLDTLECRLSCKVRQVRTPLPHRMIHERIVGLYVDDPVKGRSVTDTVFNRDRVEKVSLKRVSMLSTGARIPAM